MTGRERIPIGKDYIIASKGGPSRQGGKTAGENSLRVDVHHEDGAKDFPEIGPLEAGHEALETDHEELFHLLPGEALPPGRILGRHAEKDILGIGETVDFFQQWVLREMGRQPLHIDSL